MTKLFYLQKLGTSLSKFDSKCHSSLLFNSTIALIESPVGKTLLLISDCRRFVYNVRVIHIFLLTQAYRILIGLQTVRDVNNKKAGISIYDVRQTRFCEGLNWNSEFEN